MEFYLRRQAGLFQLHRMQEVSRLEVQQDVRLPLIKLQWEVRRLVDFLYQLLSSVAHHCSLGVPGTILASV